VTFATVKIRKCVRRGTIIIIIIIIVTVVGYRTKENKPDSKDGVYFEM
jgi:hypothetical protein